MHVKGLTQYPAHRKPYRVAIDVTPMTPGPLEERGNRGRWTSGYTAGAALHLTGLSKWD